MYRVGVMKGGMLVYLFIYEISSQLAQVTSVSKVL